jgi:hypothetical protein
MRSARPDHPRLDSEPARPDLSLPVPCADPSDRLVSAYRSAPLSPLCPGPCGHRSSTVYPATTPWQCGTVTRARGFRPSEARASLRLHCYSLRATGIARRRRWCRPIRSPAAGVVTVGPDVFVSLDSPTTRVRLPQPRGRRGVLVGAHVRSALPGPGTAFSPILSSAGRLESLPGSARRLPRSGGEPGLTITQWQAHDGCRERMERKDWEGRAGHHCIQRVTD